MLSAYIANSGGINNLGSYESKLFPPRSFPVPHCRYARSLKLETPKSLSKREGEMFVEKLKNQLATKFP